MSLETEKFNTFDKLRIPVAEFVGPVFCIPPEPPKEWVEGRELAEDEYLQEIDGKKIVRKRFKIDLDSGVGPKGFNKLMQIAEEWSDPAAIEKKLGKEAAEKVIHGEEVDEFEKAMRESDEEFLMSEKKKSGECGVEVDYAQERQDEEGRKKEYYQSPEFVAELKDRLTGDLNWVPKESVLTTICSKHNRELWCVKGMVLIRDKGVCRVCGDRVRGNTWVLQKVEKAGPWSEDNSFLMCGQCAKCRYIREMLGSKVERMKKIKLYTLNRRYKGYRATSKLSDKAREVMLKLKRENELGLW